MPKKPPVFDETFQLEIPAYAVGFDVDSFDALIKSQGVEMVHHIAIGCPVGQVDQHDVRQPHEHHTNCSNGFLYIRAGVVICSFMSNSGGFKLVDTGRIEGGDANLSIPRFYEDGDQASVQMASFDRLYLAEESITVDNWEKFQAHVSGVDRLQFPATEVFVIVDSREKWYRQNVDFGLVNGQVKWFEGKGPGVDPKTGKGLICSIRYSYRPFWYIKRFIHEVRVSQAEDGDGNRTIIRMPQAVVVQREIHFQKQRADELAANTENRQDSGPPDGQFGPR